MLQSIPFPAHDREVLQHKSTYKNGAIIIVVLLELRKKKKYGNHEAFEKNETTIIVTHSSVK